MNGPTTSGAQPRPPAGDDDERAARAVWSGLAEPGDELAGVLVQTAGPVVALEWVRRASAEGGVGGPAWDRLQAGLAPQVSAQVVRAVERWAGRLDEAERRSLPHLESRTGAIRLVVPGDPDWPVALEVLGPAAPSALWVRGALPARFGDDAAPRSCALVGSRASTGYGEHVAAELGHGLSARGLTVVSGGAYGIDAAAHRGALAADGPTVVVLAGGVDRAYPAGNARLFQETVARGGAVVAESPPGSLPTRSRFLQRNRLIAALGGATVVVEAAWRSGALSTARHALRLLRPLGAVPGPVTSAASAGCHVLLRTGEAVCVTDADEVAELVAGQPPAAAPSVPVDAFEGLDPVARRVHDCLSTRRGDPPTVVASRAGVEVAQVRGALGLLELAGLARRDGEDWSALAPHRRAR